MIKIILPLTIIFNSVYPMKLSFTVEHMAYKLTLICPKGLLDEFSYSICHIIFPLTFILIPIVVYLLPVSMSVSCFAIKLPSITAFWVLLGKFII
jgi:hypothetical protein